MAESNKAKFVRVLRAISNYVDGRDFDEDARFSIPTLYLFCDDAVQFGRQVAAAGACEKESTDSYLNANVIFGDTKLQICVNHEYACTRVKVGERVIPAKPETVLPATPEKTEDVFEWECPPSFLGMKDEAKEDAETEETVSAGSDF
jgi:hypothetical protein